MGEIDIVGLAGKEITYGTLAGRARAEPFALWCVSTADSLYLMTVTNPIRDFSFSGA